MNRIVIIGNGFDLAHGVPTRYEDFMLDWLKDSLKEAIRKDTHRSEFWTIKSHSNNNFSDLKWIDEAESFKSLKEYAENHKSFQFINNGFMSHRIIPEIEKKKWVDIEAVYYGLLKALSKNQPYSTNIDNLNKEFDLIRAKLIGYIKKVIKDFSHDQKLFADYISLIKKNQTFHRQLEANDTTIKNFKIGIVNFNYTPIVKDYFERLNNGHYDLIQIHGSIDNEESIIFGFGDELDEKYQEIENKNDNIFFKHIKSFRYLQNSNYQKIIDLTEDEEDGFEVVVFGHSLGLSDRTLLNQIFESPNLRKILLYYYEDSKGHNDYLEKTFEISRHFRNKGNMRVKIVPFDQSEPMPQLIEV